MILSLICWKVWTLKIHDMVIYANKGSNLWNNSYTIGIHMGNIYISINIYHVVQSIVKNEIVIMYNCQLSEWISQEDE